MGTSVNLLLYSQKCQGLLLPNLTKVVTFAAGALVSVDPICPQPRRSASGGRRMASRTTTACGRASEASNKARALPNRNNNIANNTTTNNNTNNNNNSNNDNSNNDNTPIKLNNMKSYSEASGCQWSCAARATARSGTPATTWRGPRSYH